MFTAFTDRQKPANRNLRTISSRRLLLVVNDVSLVVVDAVPYEQVSGANTLFSREKTGNFRKNIAISRLCIAESRDMTGISG